MADTRKTSPSAPPEVFLLPSDRFFVRTVPLAAGAGVAAQVELALESLSPFPLGQLYHGYLLSPARDSALVFAAYRKRFANDETAGWGGADAVLPAFLALLGNPPDTPVVRLWSESRTLTAAVWDGRGPLPVAVMARETEQPADAAQRAAFVAEVRARTGLPAATVQELSGAARATRDASGDALRFEVAEAPEAGSFSLKRGEVDVADVRDKEFLTGRRALLRRDLYLWRAFQACLAGLAAMLLLEAGLLAGGFWLQTIKDEVRQHEPEVKKIETAHSLSTRIEEITHRRLMPFEMLALINENRPESIRFVRSTTTGLYTLEVEAQTASAADVGQYEAVLRAAPQLSGVETRDLRSREGVTSFILTVTFRPESLSQETGT